MNQDNDMNGTWLILMMFFALLIFASMGCASVPVQPPQLILQSEMKVGVNGLSYGDELPEDTINSICQWGHQVFRAAVRSGVEATKVIGMAQECQQVSVILLVENQDPQLLQELVPIAVNNQNIVVAVELWNEPDLQNATPQVFGLFVQAGYNMFRNAGYKGDIISGGISSHRPFSDGIEFLRASKQYFGDNAQDIVCGVHTYQEGYAGWIGQLQSVCATIAITEFGKPSTNSAEDANQLAYLSNGFDYFRTIKGLKYAIVYQLMSCPGATGICNYGLLRTDWTEKMAVQLMIQEGHK